MTKKQIAWASKHDWYIGNQYGKVIARDDMNQFQVLYFDDFEELYHWAGY